MPYIAEKPKLSRSIEELRNTIPGWGVDLNRKDRPAFPKENFAPLSTGAHWDFPERQIERWPRERSVEHKFLTPVFGTSCPPRGLSGLIRRYAYRFSEGRTAHWTLLMLADRVDVAEHRVLALGQGQRGAVDRHFRADVAAHGVDRNANGICHLFRSLARRGGRRTLIKRPFGASRGHAA